MSDSPERFTVNICIIDQLPATLVSSSTNLNIVLFPIIKDSYVCPTFNARVTLLFHFLSVCRNRNIPCAIFHSELQKEQTYSITKTMLIVLYSLPDP